MNSEGLLEGRGARERSRNSSDMQAIAVGRPGFNEPAGKEATPRRSDGG